MCVCVLQVLVVGSGVTNAVDYYGQLMRAAHYTSKVYMHADMLARHACMPVSRHVGMYARLHRQARTHTRMPAHPPALMHTCKCSRLRGTAPHGPARHRTARKCVCTHARTAFARHELQCQMFFRPEELPEQIFNELCPLFPFLFFIRTS